MVRLRVQLTPHSLFVKNITLTVMGLPQIKVSAIPMTEKGINVLNLTINSRLLNNSIATVANSTWTRDLLGCQYTNRTIANV
jgi:Ca2+-dependent lipid-binding protein